MIIDVHTHVWPDAIAARALDAAPPELERLGNGTVDSLLGVLDAAGIDRAVCLGVANAPHHVGATNAFAASLDRERFVGFGSIHVELDVETNLRSLREHGLRGVKLNPPFQGFSLDDRRLAQLLDALQGNFVVLTHTGNEEASGGRAICSPRTIRKLVRRFPRLELIAAHFGGYHDLDQAEDHVVGLPIYIDTSWPPGITSLPAGRIRSLIERHGPDRVLFGSDWPMADPAADIAAVESLGLADADLMAVLGGNAAGLLGLKL